MIRHNVLTAAAALLLSTALASAEDITLKASHQWPGGKGDVRDEMVQIIKPRRSRPPDVGRRRTASIPASPCSSPSSSGTPWSRASSTSPPSPWITPRGKHPQFSATLMPGLVKNHDHAKRLNDSGFHGRHQEDH